MNISNYLLEYLTLYGKAEVEGFGVFTAENVAAVFDEDKRILLPPGKKINFLADYEISDSKFLRFLASRKNITEAAAAAEVKQQTDFWKNKINEGENFMIENLGEYKISGESAIFTGNRIEGENSDFYGLEEINLNELKKKTGKKIADKADNSQKNYRFNRLWLWIIVLAVPVSGMLYMALNDPELIFGKKSNLAAPQKKTVLKKDSSQIKFKEAVSDSLKQDSLKKTVVAPAKKWTAKKFSKKYPKNKWHKAKKRVNHSR